MTRRQPGGGAMPAGSGDGSALPARTAVASLVLACALAAAPALLQAQPFDGWLVLRPEQPTLLLPGDPESSAAPCAEADALGPLEPLVATVGSQLLPDAPLTLTLTRAVAIALCANPQVRQSWYAVMSQSAQIGLARAAWLPTVTANLSNSRDVNDVTGAGGGPQSSIVKADGKNFTLNWLLFDAGTRSATVRQSEDNLAAALASRDATLQAVFAGALQAWYDASAAAASVAAARQAEATAAETLKAADARRDAGAITAVDALQARTALAQARLARVRAEGNERTAGGALARAIGLDIRTPVRPAADTAAAASAVAAGADPAGGPPTSSPAATAALSADLATLIGDALASHPSVRAAKAQRSAAQARLQAIQAEAYPTLSVSYGNYLNGRPGIALTSAATHERLTVVTLSIPLFDGLARNYRAQDQLAIIKSRDADIAAVQSQVGFEVWRGWQALQVETEAVETTAELVRSAREALNAARARYRAGAIDVVELLNAQRDDANAQQERIQALANWRVARLRLLASLGTLGFWALDR